jgi:hypothetical protein
MFIIDTRERIMENGRNFTLNILYQKNITLLIADSQTEKFETYKLHFVSWLYFL